LYVFTPGDGCSFGAFALLAATGAGAAAPASRYPFFTFSATSLSCSAFARVASANDLVLV
jgi:hypothetical protein